MVRSNITIALQSLLAARTRTILTTLGITIGVASILLVFAAGNGARAKASENVSSLPATTSLLSSGTGAPETRSAFETSASRSASVFTERDLGTLRESKLATAQAPITEIAGPISYHGVTDQSAFVAGTSQDLFSLLGLTFVDGGAFGDSDTSSVVLGNAVAERLFGTELASGKTLTIRGDTYTVVGVLANNPLPADVTGVPVNSTALMPYQQTKRYTSGYVQFSKLFIRSNRADNARISDTLFRNHDSQTDFTLTDASKISPNTPLLPILVSVTAVTAGLSLLIGGIGIMNIMLVNVSERTREIGIRKSIGASNATILVQFLIEATVMSLAGGILGVLVGIGAGVIGGLLLPFGILFTPLAVLGVLGVSVIVGVLFGLFPAIRAARKDTIEALRYYQ